MDDAAEFSTFSFRKLKKKFCSLFLHIYFFIHSDSFSLVLSLVHFKYLFGLSGTLPTVRSRDVTTGATDAISTKEGRFYPPSQRSHLTFFRGYVPETPLISKGTTQCVFVSYNPNRLPVPWLIFTIIFQKPISVSSAGMVCSIALLFSMLMLVFFTILICHWKMSKGMGVAMFFFYFVFVIVSLGFEYEYYRCPI